MDKFIKSVPLIALVSLLAVVWQSGDAEYSNEAASALCALVVILFTAVVYIVMGWFNQRLMPAGRFTCVMFGAGILAFAVLYFSLEYFYT